MIDTAQAVFLWFQQRTDAIFHQPRYPNVWLDIRIFPLYFTALSAAFFLLSALHHHHRIINRNEAEHAIDEDLTRRRKFGGRVNALGGWSVMLWKFAKVLCCATFFGTAVGLFVFSDAEEVPFVVRLGTVITAAYTTLLSALLLSPTLSKRTSFSLSLALNIALLLVTAIYSLRNLWPYATFDRTPLDLGPDQVTRALLWTMLGAVFVAGIVIPLFVPRVYEPLNPLNPSPHPAPEQTACIASLTVFSFLDPIILHPTRQERIPTFAAAEAEDVISAKKAAMDGHIPLEQFPPLADYDRAAVLRRGAFPHMDAFTKGDARERHVFWGLLAYFKRSLLTQSLTIFLLSVTELIGPIAMNRLLAYLEAGGPPKSNIANTASSAVGEAAAVTVRPWFWILLLFIGPFMVELCLQWYIFVSTHSVVHIEAIMTQLIFEHALRIRVKAETTTFASSQGDTSQAPTANSGLGDLLVDPPASETLVAMVGAEEMGTDSVTPTIVSESVEASTTIASESSTLREGETANKKGSERRQETGDEKREDNAKGKNLVGKINNLISTDLAQIQAGRDFLWATLYSPIAIVLDAIFLYILLGWASLVGLVVMIALLPVPAQLTKLFHGLQKEKMKASDDRVQTVTEVMGMLRMVKLFAWESRVEAQIDEKRKAEMVFVWKRGLNQTIINSVNYTIPLVHMVVSYWVYTSIMKQAMTASIVFSSITVFMLIRNQFFHCMVHIPAMIQAKVSFDRINEFLTQTELLDQYTDLAIERETEALASTASHASKIGFGSAHFSWSTGTRDGSLTPSGTRQEYLLRIDEDLIFKEGTINLIVGPTGSGKTSMLMALLGEMHFVPQGPGAWFNLPREGGVAYAAQESWVQNETIRDNILFGAAYDEMRYNKVIYQCALRRDLDLFDAGDRTEVGEKGLTLSGGQKARLTLARAVYSSANILLLDDVLAALDVHTARWIVEKCLKGDLIRGRTVIFVTHNVALTSPIADFVVTLSTHGRVLSAGSVQDALHHDSTFRKELDAEKTVLAKADLKDAIESVDDEGSDPTGIPASAADKTGKLIVEEEVELGRMSKRTLFLLARSMAGRWGILYWMLFFGYLAALEICDTGRVWWLGRLANAYESSSGSVDVKYYLGVYILLMVLCVLFLAALMVLHAVGSVRASVKLHEELIHSVLQTTLRWLDSTPTSRVITRCTQDIDAVDTNLCTSLLHFADITGYILMRLVAVIIFTPIFGIPGVFIGIVGSYLAHLYMKVQLSIKREMSNAKSPVIGHFSAAIAGLVSIRAYGAEEAFKTESMRRIDLYTRAARSFWNLNRWISVRITLLSCLFTAGLATYMIYVVRAQNASDIGFSINMAVGFSVAILWWVRMLNEVEVQANSLERIHQYMVIEHEPGAKPEGVPPAYWPASGRLAVERLSARYSTDGPCVLEDISFNVESGERIGIVGRTGSGKSSLTLSLLRTILTEGEVYLDGLPTSQLNLDALRSSITIIPQVPELMSGTLRHNLDPFDQHDDAKLNDILRSSGLSSMQNEMDDARLTLDSPIASGGGNLSVGQKQILALARAMLRHTKILILDEATSAIDYETDALIQRSLRNEFKDVTLITIAHRLQTIMDSDKIMVLDAGRMVEFDRPATLLENRDGLLYSLVSESSDKDTLISMAQAKASSC